MKYDDYDDDDDDGDDGGDSPNDPKGSTMIEDQKCMLIMISEIVSTVVINIEN